MSESAEAAASSGAPENSICVCVRVRPLNERERDEGHRVCVSFDDPSKQVVLTAVDKNTLLQLRGNTAKGYAFDRRYGQEEISDRIYDDVILQLVENCFKGYNATVLAYGQTGSGKTHTMAGGVGIHGKHEEGIIPRVIRHVFAIVDGLKKKQKPGEKVEITACALELYNEDLLDLSSRSGRSDEAKGWDGVKKEGSAAPLKLQERPVGKDGRVVPEVIGVKEMSCTNSVELKKIFDDCMINRSTSSTKLNDRSSRSHAIFTITIHRTIVEVMNELGDDFRARVRTSEFSSKLHLVDLAGSERVKRSGVTGKELKEATHINSGLLALGNVIVALSNEGDGKKKGHVPYRDSKLTRLLQDSLGGNSLTVLISCISPSEQDFEETNNTLKYANRACHIKNTPLPNKFTMLEEDLLPTMPMGAPGMGLGMVQLQSLLEDHERIKENRERKAREKAEKERLRMLALQEMRDEIVKKPGFQRLRATQYDELRRQLASRGVTDIPSDQVIGDDTLVGFARMSGRLAQSVDQLSLTPGSAAKRHSSAVKKAGAGRRGSGVSQSVRVGAGKAPGQTFADWLSAQQAADAALEAGSQGAGPEYQDDDFFHQGEGDATGEDFVIHEDGEEAGGSGVVIDDDEGDGAGALIIDDDEAPEAAEEAEAAAAAAAAAGEAQAAAAAAAVVTADAAAKSKFKRGLIKTVDDHSASMASLADSTAAAAGSDLLDGDTTAAEEGDDEVELGEEDDVLLEEEEAEEDDDEDEVFDPIQDNVMPRLLARFKVNQSDVLSVFKAATKEDFQDVIGLLPENTPLPASDKMTYLLARLECASAGRDINAAVARVGNGEASMNEAVGPAVGCLMATFGTNMISSCIFEFEDPADLKYYSVEERIELWGLQIPHNSVRPTLTAEDLEAAAAAAAATPSKGAEDVAAAAGSTITWSSVDRLNMSIGLLYALCNHARDQSIRCGFCVPRPQLLRRWLQAGVRMKQITTALKLIYPSSAHDYEYYKASTVAFFMVHEVREALEKVLAIVPVPDTGKAAA